MTDRADYRLRDAPTHGRKVPHHLALPLSMDVDVLDELPKLPGTHELTFYPQSIRTGRSSQPP